MTIDVVADTGAPYPLIQAPLGTTTFGAAAVFPNAVALDGQIYQEPNQPCIIASAPGCATFSWSVSACGGPSVAIPSTEPLSGSPPFWVDDQTLLDPFSITNDSCNSEIISLCVTDGSNPPPGICTTTVLELIWPTQ